MSLNIDTNQNFSRLFLYQFFWVISKTLLLFSNFVFRWISEFFTTSFPRCKAAFIDDAITVSTSIHWSCRSPLRMSHQLETFLHVMMICVFATSFLVLEDFWLFLCVETTSRSVAQTPSSERVRLWIDTGSCCERGGRWWWKRRCWWWRQSSREVTRC